MRTDMKSRTVTGSAVHRAVSPRQLPCPPSGGYASRSSFTLERSIMRFPLGLFITAYLWTTAGFCSPLRGLGATPLNFDALVSPRHATRPSITSYLSEFGIMLYISDADLNREFGPVFSPVYGFQDQTFTFFCFA